MGGFCLVACCLLSPNFVQAEASRDYTNVHQLVKATEEKKSGGPEREKIGADRLEAYPTVVFPPIDCTIRWRQRYNQLDVLLGLPT